MLDVIDEPGIIHWTKVLLLRVIDVPLAPEDISDNEPLWEELDSIATVELVAAIEEFFEISIPDEDIGAQLFASVTTLAAMVTTRLDERRRGV